MAYLACLSNFSFGWRNSCSQGQNIILQTENETFIDGLEELAREKHKSVTGWEDVAADIATVSLSLPSLISQAKRFTQSQSLPWDESKRERSEKIAFKAKLNPSNEKPNDRTRTNEKQKKIDN